MNDADVELASRCPLWRFSLELPRPHPLLILGVLTGYRLRVSSHNDHDSATFSLARSGGSNKPPPPWESRQVGFERQVG
jgi:hypothetical protein